MIKRCIVEDCNLPAKWKTTGWTGAYLCNVHVDVAKLVGFEVTRMYLQDPSLKWNGHDEPLTKDQWRYE